ncbi:EcsC family protein [Niallia taxi]|uniref:EcsC family protein n=1 Tax=Niallia taxi TaxID=2499688 RepID=UPI002E1A690D|nr:EcsC family protein [Niallia taxi]MED4122337.1 EcsC family protein [Niallia taxi]
MKDEVPTYLNQREIKLLDTLTIDYQNFIKPNIVQKGLNTIQEKASDLVPVKIKDSVAQNLKKATEWNVIQKAFEKAGKGFGVVQENTARITLDKKRVVGSLYTNSNQLQDFNEICRLRSYEIEKTVVNRRKFIDLPIAFLGGGTTGFFGLYGVPFNLAYTFLMYYRTVQSIALYYGYDVVNDPRELEFASSVTITCLSPGQQMEAETLGSLIGQMMFASSLTALKESLKKNTYEKMAKKGGMDLLYVQIRALANAQAQKALGNAGKNGIEAGIFKNLLEQLGKRMSQETGKKAIPVIGAVVGSLGDTYTINRIITGANLIYHKRFLYEKNTRVKLLNEINDENPLILDYDEIIKDEIIEGEFIDGEEKED